MIINQKESHKTTHKLLPQINPDQKNEKKEVKVLRNNVNELKLWLEKMTEE